MSDLIQYRESRNQNLDVILAELADGLALIAKSASVENKDKYRLAYEKYQVDACCATMVRSAQQMLSIVAELKRGLLLGNFPAMIENTRDRLRTLSDVQQGVDLGHLQAELSEAILETEAEMYRV